MIKIYSLGGEILASVPITSGAVIREELMTADEVQLSWNSDSGDVLPAGSYIEINDEKYSLLEPYQPDWIDEAFYKYAPTFQSRVMYWQHMPIPVYTYEEDGATIKSREFDWEFLGTPEDAVFIAAQAIFNETGERWDYEVAEGLKETVSIQAQNATIFSVLSDIAEQCETEWWVDKDNNVLHLSRCERYSELPLEVGVHVSSPNITSDREGYYTRFYALGSTKNMTQENGSGAIAQLVNKRLTLDPKKYPQGYKDIKGHFENGVYVSDLQQGEIFSTTLVFEDVFPSSGLQISSARKRLKYRVDDAGEKIRLPNGEFEQYAIWYFRLDDFEFTEDLILEGKTLSVAFKSGKLAGREFELSYHGAASSEQYKDDVEPFEVQAGDYEIIMDESEGVILPMVDYIIPEQGDKVVLFNINMPPEYTESAYVELEKELNKEIEKRLQDNNNYEFESYPTAFRDSALSLEVGRRVSFKYNGVEHSTRVLSVEKRLDCEYQQKVRIGNQKINGTRKEMREEIRNVSEEVNEMDKTQRISLSLQRNYAQSLRNSIANYQGLKDTIELLQGAFKGFSEGINPVSVETMLLMLGDNSLQFRIFRDIESLAPLNEPVVYDAATKHLHVAKSGIVHYTLGINAIQPSISRDLNGYLKWNMDEYTSGELIEPEARYYLYAVVSKTTQEGWYELIDEQRDLDGGSYYNLLVGILNAEYSGTRSFVPLYGYTAITGGQISTDVIKSTDGQTYFDLVNGVIAGDIRFKSTEGGVKSVDEQFSLVDKNVQNLQDQIDGEVENHFYKGTPTTSNYPAVEWTSDIQKINHIGDTYTDIEEFVDSKTTPNAGKSWRWCRCDDMVGITDYVEATDKDGVTYKLHWHPIADTDAVKALLRVYELEKKVDDAEYLKETFKKGSTEIAGGVVMSQMVAVRNSEEEGGEIEAFLNGSDFAQIPNHYGKLILASGIPDTTASGSKDLAERAKEARTRIYENGVLQSDYVFLDKGFLGQFYADATKLKTNSTYDDKDVSMLVMSVANGKDLTSGLGFRNISSEDGTDTQVSIASRTGKTQYDLVDKDKKVAGNMVISYKHGLSSTVKSSGSQKYKNLSALHVSCSGTSAKEHFAIRSEAGTFAGLRPRLQRNPKDSYYGYVLSILDHTIVCEDGVSEDFTYTLPSSPEIGQHYEFIKVKSSRPIIFKTTDGKEIFRIDNASSDTSKGIGASWGGKIELTYDGTQWLMVLMGS